MSDFDFELAAQVHAIASKVKTSEVYWISTPLGEVETNNGNDWCRDCSYYKARHLRKHDRRNAAVYFIDGGSRYNSDSHSFCAGCALPLLVSLTDEGVALELCHYREYGINQGHLEVDAFFVDLLMNSASWGSEYLHEIQAHAVQIVSLHEAHT